MIEGKYCYKCHPKGSILEERHNKDQFNKNYMPYWKACDKCKLLKPLWFWAGNEPEVYEGEYFG